MSPISAVARLTRQRIRPTYGAYLGRQKGWLREVKPLEARPYAFEELGQALEQKFVSWLNQGNN